MAAASRNRSVPRWLIVGVVALLIVAIVGGGLLFRRPSTALAAPASILGWSPGASQGSPPAAPLTIYFSRSMNHSSVEKAFKLSPAIPGVFTWSDTSVAFQPNRPLKPQSTYHLAVDSSARDDQNKPLVNPLSESFTTGQHLKVSDFTPASRTTSVPVNGLISITFNHPMVALAGLGTAPSNPPGWNVTISPRTAGRGSWLGTSTWVFHPTSGLIPSSTYTVGLAGSTQDSWGDRLGQGLSWTFATVKPAVIAQSPKTGATEANPEGAVTVTFNQEMEHQSTADAFTVDAGGKPVPGRFSWDGSTLSFRPLAALDPNLLYTANVDSAARSASGQGTLGTPVSWTFRVASPPHVVHADVPTGSYKSDVVDLRFSAPVNQASFDRHLTIEPAVSGMGTYVYAETNNGPLDHYAISGNFEPSSSYTLTIAAGAEDRFGRAIKQPYTTHFTTGPLSPSVMLYGIGGVGQGVSFTAGRIVDVPLQVINVPRLKYTLIRTTPSEGFNGYGQFSKPLKPPPGVLVKSWSAPLPTQLNKLQNPGVRLVGSNGSALGPGLYWLGVESEGMSKSSDSGSTASAELILAANTSVTFKSSTSQVLAWLTSPKTGKPVAGVQVRFLNDSGKTIASGTSDSKGVVSAPKGPNTAASAVLVDDGSHFGMAMQVWSPQAHVPYPDQNENGVYIQPPDGSYVYTDRPIYRPGQKVHFRAVLWRNRDGDYTHLPQRTVSVMATDGTGHTIYTKQAPIDSLGTVHGQFLLPSAARTGFAQVIVTKPGANAEGQSQAYASFTIAAYRKPEFLTSVTTNRKQYEQGQTVRATIAVKYVFGAPVANQNVSWTANMQNRSVQPPGWETYQFGDPDALYQQSLAPSAGGGQFGQVVKQGQGTTDSAGVLTVNVPVDLRKTNGDQTITVEATTTDVNHQSVSGRVQVPASRASFAIGVSPSQQTVPQGQSVTVHLASVKGDGAPVGKQALTATISKRTFTSEMATGGFGSTYWKQVPHDTQISTENVTTNGSGVATLTFTPKDGGDYYLVIEGKDVAGNTARSALSIYSSAAGFSDWGATADATLSMRPDKATYRVGDTAHILVGTPFSAGIALVTVERATIRRHWVSTLPTNSTTIDVPITLADLPNVFVSVTAYRGQQGATPPDWRYGVINLKVNTDPRHLTIRLSQSRSHYHPGDKATYTVLTTDANGKPVSAQVSLSLVDVSVLALQADPNPNILRALYGQHPLEVSTVSEGAVSVDRFNQPPNFQLRPGGGGGGGGGQGEVPSFAARQQAGAKVRKRFADTAYWTPTLATDGQGHATVTVTLPDNLTTWRLQARGVTSDFQVGQAILDSISTQDVILRPVTPRFLLQGDSVRLGTAINNNLDTPISGNVLISAPGLRMQSDASQSVDVPAHGERLLLWNVSVPAGRSTEITFRASPTTSGVQGDAVQVKLPISVPLTDETVATSGQVYGPIEQTILVPGNARSDPGGLQVQVTSSLVLGFGTGYPSLGAQAFDSNDDIAARVLAASALVTRPAALEGLSSGEHARLPSAVSAGVARLTSAQLSDGGWPWFSGPSASSDLVVTLDVVEALHAAGDRWTPAVGTKFRTYLTSALSGESPDGRARILGVLADAGMPDAGAATSLAGDSVARARLSAVGRADLARALAAGGDSQTASTLIIELGSMAMVSATGAHWEGGAVSAVAATAMVVQTLVRLAPSNSLVPAGARWLLLARQGPGWDSNRDTALAISALSAYSGNAHESMVATPYSVAIDGTTRRSAARASVTRIPISSLKLGSVSTMSITRQTQNGNLTVGQLYYLARLRYFVPAASISPLNQGIGVSRRYVDLQGKAVKSVAAGSLVRVEITVTTGQTLEHVNVVDPIPPGLEAVNQILNTSQQGLFPPPFPPPPGTGDLNAYLQYTDVRDDRIVLSMGTLPPGTYRYTYLAQATTVGAYGAAPTRASEVFFPEVFGRSGGQTFTVR